MKHRDHKHFSTLLKEISTVVFYRKIYKSILLKSVLLLFFLFFSSSLIKAEEILPPGNALSLDGINDYVDLPPAVATSVSEGTAITIEYWFKGSNLQSAVRLQPDENNYIVAGWSYPPQHIISTDGGGNGISVGSPSIVYDGTWHHIAMTWSKNGQFTSYLDGSQVATRAAANVNLPPVNYAKIGTYNTLWEFTNGLIDEVRIWSIARTQSDLQQTMHKPLTGSETGLVAYYPFDQGTAGNNNPGVTTLTEITTNHYNGTLTNFGLTGSISNWVSSGAFCPFLKPTTNISSTGCTVNWYEVKNATGYYLDIASNSDFSSKLIDNQYINTGTTVFYSASFALASNKVYYCQLRAVVNGVTCPNSRISTFTFFSSGNALNFDGANDYVALPNSVTSTLNGGSTITIEYWFKGTFLQSPVRFQDGQYIVGGWYNQHIISTDGGTGDGISVGNSALVYDGNWHHVAMTWQRATVNGFKSYLDGQLVAQRDSRDVPLPTINSHNYLGSYQGTHEFLNGSLDEVRIWNTARSQEDIQADMFNGFTGSETSLIAYYNFNRGVSEENNADIKTLPDLSCNGNDGTLSDNFALNGATSNWVGSITTKAPVLLPTTFDLNPNTFIATWDPVPDVTSYRLELSTDNCFWPSDYGFDYPSSQTVANITTSGSKLFYRVRAISNNSISDHSQVRVANFGRIYVDKDVDGGLYDGSSWENAYADLSQALEDAGPGAEIWVAGGTYYPSHRQNPEDERSKTFFINKPLKIYGGFAGNSREGGGEESIDQRDIEANQTILSGDFDEDGEKENNSYNVVVFSEAGINSNSILNGFSITAGYAGGIEIVGLLDELIDDGGPVLPYSIENGGGIYITPGGPKVALKKEEVKEEEIILFDEDSENFGPVIKNCDISNNYANKGGGIYVENCSPDIDKSNIHDNFNTEKSLESGGGIFLSYSEAKIENCTIQNNTSYTKGAGMFIEFGSPKIIKNTFYNNVVERGESGGNGGAIFIKNSIPVIRNNYFDQNKADGNGGALYITDTRKVSKKIPIVINRNTFIGNTAGYDGGAIYFVNNKPRNIFNMTNNLLINNSAGYSGGGLYIEGCNGTILNNTISGNICNTEDDGYTGGGIYFSFGNSIEMTNNIVWENTNNEADYDQIDFEGDGEFKLAGDFEKGVYITYCDIQMEDGVYEGTGNINTDPLFKDPSGDDYSLQFISPCINNGYEETNSDSPKNGGVGDNDLAGNPRFLESTIDIGAYEVPTHPISPVSDVFFYGQGCENFEVDWINGSNDNDYGVLVFVTEGNDVILPTSGPEDNSWYSSSSEYGLGDSFTDENSKTWYAVYNGNSNYFDFSTNLGCDKKYNFMFLPYFVDYENDIINYIDISNAGDLHKAQTQEIKDFDDMSKVYGDNCFTPGAYLESGLNVVYRFVNPNQNVAQFDNGSICILNAGSTDIEVSQQSSDVAKKRNGVITYLRPDPITRTLFVEKADLTITAKDKSINYHSALPVFDADYTGWVYDDEEVDGSPNFSIIDKDDNIITSEFPDAGDYKIKLTAGSLISDNYNFILKDGKLKINKATGSLTLTCLNQVYTGAPLYPCASTNPPGMTVDFDASKISKRGGQAINAGTYNITGTINNINYQGTSTVTFVISKATPEITWNTPAPITYGTLLGSTQLNATANVNGSISYSISSGTLLNVNTHVINANFTPTDPDNYNSADATVQLVVNKKALNVIAENKSRNYYLQNPPLTFTYSGFENNENPDVIDSKPTISTTATITSNSGNYPIVACCGTDNNYSFNYTNGTLTISTILSGIESKAAIGVKETTELLWGKLLSHGGEPGLEYGFCISMLPNPTIQNQKVGVITLPEAKSLLDIAKIMRPDEYMAYILVLNQLSDMDFASYVKNLRPDTVYFARAYAINSSGTVYGKEIVFRTKPWKTGINDISEAEIMISPNPTKGLVTITASSGFDMVSVIDLSGKVLTINKLANITTKKEFDFSFLSKGLYLIKVQNGKESHIIKLVITK